MSYCALVCFEDGKPGVITEFKNSCGGAAFIWDVLYDKYLKDPNKKPDCWLLDPDSLWPLAKRADLPLFERVVLASTYDRALVRDDHFAEFSGHLREFVKTYPAGDKACHLSAWADLFDKSESEAIGFYGTSVSENLWIDWDEEKDGPIPYNLNERDDHFEVYDYLKAG